MKPGPATDIALLEHMRDAVARIRAYTAMDPSVFHGSPLVQDAVIRNLQTPTESPQRLSPEIKATEPGVPWRELAGFRNVLVHAYLGVDLGLVWSAVAQDLPTLGDGLDRMWSCSTGAAGAAG